VPTKRVLQARVLAQLIKYQPFHFLFQLFNLGLKDRHRPFLLLILTKFCEKELEKAATQNDKLFYF